MLTRYQIGALLLVLSAACCAVVTGSRAVAEPVSQSPASTPGSSNSQTTNNDRLISHPLRAVEGATANRFVLLQAVQTGIDFVHRWNPPEHDFDFRTLLNGGGVCLGDYDSDGLTDIYLTRQQGSNRLYRNLGDFRFQDVTEAAGLVDEMWGMGASFVDIDNDGDLDLYACAFQSPNRLYINRGDRTFAEQAAAYGLDYNGASIMMAMADYDNDGQLDGYLLTNRRQPKNHAQFKQRVLDGLHITSTSAYFDQELKEFMGVIMRPNHKFLPIMTGQRDLLFHNRGGGKFEEVSRQSGIDGYDIGLSATWWDYDNDGLPDLYVANDYLGPDRLYRNQGDGSFSDMAAQALPHTPWSSMGADVADLNNDGRLDFMGSDMSSSSHYRDKVTMGNMENMNWFLEWPKPRQYMRNTVYINSGTGRFMEAAFQCNLAKTDWTWAIKCVDFDDDGRVDVFATNGMTRDWENADLVAEADKLGGYHSPAGLKFWLDLPPNAQRNHAYRNLGKLHFESVGSAWGLDHQGVSFGAAVGDLDGDGDLDLVVNNLEEPVSIYRNDLSSGHRVKIRLVGSTSNRWGIGSTVRLKNGDGHQVRHLTLARGIMSADDPQVHFGLGKQARIERLTIRWPSGHTQVFADLPADHLFTITEPEGPAPERETAVAGPTLFQRSACLDQARHKERPFNDYERQPLLPHKLSQLGPGMAWGDLDLDGLDDLYLGGAAGQSGEVYRNGGNSRFKESRKYLQNTAADRDKASEDMGVLMFDADADGDLDVYVVSGGVECAPGDETLRDRLYLNDGQGQLSLAPEGALPDLRDSGSVVTAADFDRDGDLDLFVGGRVVPGQYPVTPHSRLLQNHRGTFTDVTAQVAPELEKTGLVTGALWSDVDGDGWLDLLVTHEWGPVKLYRNMQGRLEDRTAAAGLAQRTGWYNSIAGRDIDGDGDIDYVVTNFGLNTKYHPTPDHPARIYYGDFEETGQMHIVEAKMQGDQLLPVRGKSCSQNAMPFVAKKFPKYHDFASAMLADIYTPTCLDQALAVEANSLESGVLMNDGQGHFTFRALPRIAQIAPSFGVVLTELNGDSRPDLYLGQNFYGPQRETGRMDGGLSLLLLGGAQGKFEPVWPDRSGLVVSGDAKSLTVTDLDGDHWPDLLVGINDQPLQAFVNRGSVSGQDSAGGRILAVRLHGPSGNPTAIGARVTVEQMGDVPQTAEVSAGGGYLSQSSPTLTFGLPVGNQLKQIQVRWPDGSQSTHTSSDDRVEITTTGP